MTTSDEKTKKKIKDQSLEKFWNDRIMERFIKANLFVFCCCAAGLLLLAYLIAFSCEVSWILEAHGDLPFSSYILCTQFFIIFVATTILIHGLVTGLSWGLFAWSIIIGLFSIPELVFVMIMTTQHWGLQSIHGLTELISYLVRLLINCFALICVIPTGLRWRRETQVLSQLQDLATRLQLQTPPPIAPRMPTIDSRHSSLRINNNHQLSEKNQMKINNLPPPPLGLNLLDSKNMLFGSQNEFHASIFAAQSCVQPFNKNALAFNANRTQSLMDLRCTLPGMYNPRYVLDIEDRNGKYFNISVEDLKNNIQDSIKNRVPSVNGSADAIYCSIEPNQSIAYDMKSTAKPVPPLMPNNKFSRNCVSLENLDIAKIQNDFAILHNYNQQQQQHQQHQQQQMQQHQQLQQKNLLTLNNQWQPMQIDNAHINKNIQQLYGGFGYANYANPYITANSKLSIGNESDDYRRYRDVAL